jgi:flagellar biosynthesis chaperone FliJ
MLKRKHFLGLLALALVSSVSKAFYSDIEERGHLPLTIKPMTGIAVSSEIEDLAKKEKETVIERLPKFFSHVENFQQYLKKNDNNIQKAAEQYIKKYALDLLDLSSSDMKLLKEYDWKKTFEYPKLVTKVKNNLGKAIDALNESEALLRKLPSTISYLTEKGEVVVQATAPNTNLQNYFDKLEALNNNKTEAVNKLGDELADFFEKFEGKLRQLKSGINKLDFDKIKKATKFDVSDYNLDDIKSAINALKGSDLNALIAAAQKVDFAKLKNNRAKIVNALKESGV